jgi:hypothetical protein
MISLSAPSKMPCHGYSLPASACKVGAKLVKVNGSTCSKCYALKGNYTFPSVRASLNRRLEAIKDPNWPFIMVGLILNHEKSGYFRWHDSGDIQDIDHLKKIVAIAQMLPDIKFWLPTREYSIVKGYVKDYGRFPENLTVRVSAHMIDESVSGFELTSEVTTNLERVTCQASMPKSNHKCGDCRNCWDKSVKTVIYFKH